MAGPRVSGVVFLSDATWTVGSGQWAVGTAWISEYLGYASLSLPLRVCMPILLVTALFSRLPRLQFQGCYVNDIYLIVEWTMSLTLPS